MGMQTRVYSPVAETERSPSRLAPRLTSLAGKRVALIHNGWQSLDITYREYAASMTERHKAAKVFEVRKAYASRPLPDEQFRQITEGADAVIVGLGN